MSAGPGDLCLQHDAFETNECSVGKIGTLICGSLIRYELDSAKIQEGKQQDNKNEDTGSAAFGAGEHADFCVCIQA